MSKPKNPSPRRDRLADGMIVIGCLLMTVPCVLGGVALLYFGWPVWVSLFTGY